MAVVLNGEVDAILITGGIAHSKNFTSMITERVKWIAQVHLYPGEDEMRALAMNGLRVLTGEIIPKEY
jgi:butyrate kinase